MASCADCREKQRGRVREERAARVPAPDVGPIGSGLSVCVRCRRGLSGMDRKRDTPHLEPASCGWCAMPLTAAARAQLPGAGVSTRALEEIAITC